MDSNHITYQFEWTMFEVYSIVYKLNVETINGHVFSECNFLHIERNIPGNKNWSKKLIMIKYQVKKSNQNLSYLTHSLYPSLEWNIC